MNIKKGDFIVKDDVIWVVKDYASGILLLNRFWTNREDLYGKTNTFSRSTFKHFLLSHEYTYVPKEKANTIKVLYS